MEPIKQKNLDLINNIEFGVLNSNKKYALFFSNYEVTQVGNLIHIDGGEFDSFYPNKELLELIQIMKITINELNKYTSKLSHIEKCKLAIECNECDNEYCDEVIKKIKEEMKNVKII